MGFEQKNVNILRLLFLYLTVCSVYAEEGIKFEDPALRRQSLSCEILLALGFDERYQPQLQLSQSQSLRRPLIRLGPLLAPQVINEKSLAQVKEKFQRILTPYERSKIFFYLIDHPDMIWGRFFWELYGHVYINRHKDQKKAEAGGNINPHFFANLDKDPENLIEVMRALSLADDNTQYIKFNAVASIMLNYTSRDYEFFHGNWDDRVAEHIIPLVPGALKTFRDTDPYWQKIKSKKYSDHVGYKKLGQISVDARLPQMKEFFDWLYERRERIEYAAKLIQLSLVALNELQLDWRKSETELSLNTKILFSLIMGSNRDIQAILGTFFGINYIHRSGIRVRSNDERVAWLKSLDSTKKRELRKKLTIIFRSIYNTKKKLAHSMGAIDDVGSSAEVVKAIDAVYEGLASSQFQVQSRLIINKIQNDLMLSVEHADGYQINSTNLESFIVSTLADIVSTQSKVADFSSRATAINKHIQSSAFQVTAEEIKAAVSKKENIMSSVETIDSNLMVLKDGVTAVHQIVVQALVVYDSKIQQMTEVQKSKVRHIKEIYDKFTQQSAIQLELIQSIRDSIEIETQAVDLNLIESMTKP